MERGLKNLEGPTGVYPGLFGFNQCISSNISQSVYSDLGNNPAIGGENIGERHASTGR